MMSLASLGLSVVLLGIGTGCKTSSSMTTADEMQPVASQEESGIPARSPEASPGLIDLSVYYTQPLGQPLHTDRANNDLASVPQGVQTLGGTTFDIRGLVQLAGSSLRGEFPERVDGIKVGLSCREIHIMHGTGFGAQSGETVAWLILHYENGDRRELKVNYGQHVLDWWQYPHDQAETPDSVVAWRGSNGAVDDWPSAEPTKIRLFKTTFDNPLPDVPIETVDYVSGMTLAAPFMVALSVAP